MKNETEKENQKVRFNLFDTIFFLAARVLFMIGCVSVILEYLLKQQQPSNFSVLMLLLTAIMINRGRE